MSNEIKMTLEGVAQFIRAVQLTNQKTRDRTWRVIEAGTLRVSVGAYERAPRRSGELASTIRPEFNKDKLTGYVKVGYGKLIRRSRATTANGLARHTARRQANKLKLAAASTSKVALSALDLGVYAPVVERGDPKRHKAAHPFLIPSLKEQKPSIITGLNLAPEQAAKEAGLTS